jgi:2,4-dienoyl-CoA reductase (NADPH2)
VRCLANGLGGREFELTLQPKKDERPILVVGGGVAGCECALRLAQRGYAVTLWERANALGGQLKLAARCPAKEELSSLIRYYAIMLPQLGVQVELGKTADAEAIVAAGFARCIVATGGAANPISFPGAVSAEEILNGAVIPGKRVAILGGSFKGVETARYLARASAISPEELYYLITQKAESPEVAAQMANQSSREITLIEQRPKIGFGYEPGVAWTVMQDLRRLKVHLRKNCHAELSAPGTLSLVQKDKQGNETQDTLEFDTLICAAGVTPRDDLSAALQDHGIETAAVGNCAKLGRAIDAISAAAELGCTF